MGMGKGMEKEREDAYSVDRGAGTAEHACQVLIQILKELAGVAKVCHVSQRRVGKL